MEEETRSRIGPALGKVASGLYIATARLDGRPVGMLCSFVEQCGFSPPAISIALGFDRPIIRALNDHGLFGLHILSRDNGALVKAFSRSDVAEPFDGLALAANAFDIPQLAEAWAFLACRVAGNLATGDHILYTAEVIDGALQQTRQEPMIRIRQNGFGY